MTELGQIIDVAAELRRDVTRLELEVQILGIALLALMFTVGVLTWQLWQEER